MAWVNRNTLPVTRKTSIAIRLVDYCYSRRDEKPNEFFNMANRYNTLQANLSKIPGMPIAYWVSEKIFEAYNRAMLLGDIGRASEGVKTGNNDLYLKLWYEISASKFSFGTASHEFKWYPHHKGGEYRKWYGNLEWVINWENQGYEIKNSANSGLQGKDMYFQPVICWSKITSKGTSLRYIPANCLFDSGSPAFWSSSSLRYYLGFLNSKIAEYILKCKNPTLNCQVGDIKALPILFDNKTAQVETAVADCVNISRYDWNSFEISWDFVRHPFLGFKTDDKRIADAFEIWQNFIKMRFEKLKANEEEINRIFIDIYGLLDELTPEVEDNYITIHKADLGRDVRSFISYAVGCMFGRYSLDVDGLAYAGGKWDTDKYSTFIPDKDNIIPITDEEYFEDDIVGLFCAFLKKTFGSETLEENLDFIAKALGNKGNSSRQIIRNYFQKDFFKNHCKIYKKRPIYWLFDSGKAEGFKAIVYMHRYNEDTIGNLRIDYLHRMQRIYESEILRMQEIIENSKDAREMAAATKRKEKLVKQLKETKEYDEKIAHLALARIAIELDDGVMVNYEKVQTDTNGKKLEVMAKI